MLCSAGMLFCDRFTGHRIKGRRQGEQCTGKHGGNERALTVKSKVFGANEELTQYDANLGARQFLAVTDVNAVAKCEVLFAIAAVEVYRAGLVKYTLVAIARSPHLVT